MMRSLFSAVSGLKNYQQMMDVIGNNIANVNTPGFKKSRVTFQDMLTQTIKGASLPTATTGGTNSIQIGSGVDVASIDTIFDGNSMQQTGKNTDLGISGDGLFILGNGSQYYYTRDGGFDFDGDGNFISSANGMYVQGWMPDATGTISTDSTLVNITKDRHASVPAQATTSMAMSGNLNAQLNNGALEFADGKALTPFTVDDGTNTYNCQLTLAPSDKFNTWTWTVTDTNSGQSYGSGTLTLDSATGKVTGSPTGTATIGAATFSPPAAGDDPNSFTLAGGTMSSSIPQLTYTPPKNVVPQTVYDALGNQYSVDLAFIKNSIGAWDWKVAGITDSQGNSYTPSAGGSGTIQFDGAGKLAGGATGTMSFAPTGGLIAPVTISLDFSSMTQSAANTSAAVKTQDGHTSGTLQSFSIDQTGTIIGTFSNGVSKALAQIALANFPNPGGLSNSGGNVFTETANSGIRSIHPAGTAGLGAIETESLEMSNVDLATEFSNMIIAQRGFEASSKVISASDTMLQNLANLIRG